MTPHLEQIFSTLQQDAQKTKSVVRWRKNRKQHRALIQIRIFRYKNTQKESWPDAACVGVSYKKVKRATNQKEAPNE